MDSESAESTESSESTRSGESTQATVIRGACPHDCPDTCGFLTTVEGGRAVDLRGDPDHPITQGALCVKVENYLTRVYSPDRVLYPMRRVGAKGEGKFERISWDDALGEIGARFRTIIAEDGAQAILPYSYMGVEGILNGLTSGDPFFNRLGASIGERTFCASGVLTGYIMTVGLTPGTDPESIVNSRYIIIWACNVISTNLHLWPTIAEARRRGAKVVVIDPLRSRTAQRADWHIPIRPATDGALAMGLINVLIEEDLIDHDYVAKYTVGFDELSERARKFTPTYVAEITGVPAEDIRKLAREYASAQPSVIRFGVGLERQPGGGNAVRAVCCLPALVGAWRHSGGGLVGGATPFAFPFKWDVLQRPDFIRPGTRVVNQYQLGAALTGELGLDPPIKAIFIYNTNPVVVCPDQGAIVEGLKREDLFTVVSEQFITDTADFADIVLPATTQLEQFDLMFSTGHFHMAANNPAIAPIGEAVSNSELFRRLAATMGFEDECFRMNDEETARAAVDWSAPVLDGITFESLKRDGHARLRIGEIDDYIPHAEGNFPTPSGKTEFVSSAAAGGNFVIPLFRQGSLEFQPGDSIDPLPDYVAPGESAAGSNLAMRYPLNLISPKSHAFLSSGYGNFARQQRVAGEASVTIHPDDAAPRGISDTQAVRVFNDRGSFVAVARVSPAVQPGVVAAPVGHWRKFSRSGSTVGATTPPAFADLGRAPTFSYNRVEIEAV